MWLLILVYLAVNGELAEQEIGAFETRQACVDHAEQMESHGDVLANDAYLYCRRKYDT